MNIDLIRQQTEIFLPKGIPIEGSCIYHALAARIILGSECSIIAGDSSWKFTNFDNGYNTTHFTYQFTPGVLRFGSAMPEMHVWNVYKGKYLDLTTRYASSQCKKLIGHEFEKNLMPPDYFYGEPVGPDGQWLYKPSRDATKLANMMIAKEIPELMGKNIRYRHD